MPGIWQRTVAAVKGIPVQKTVYDAHGTSWDHRKKAPPEPPLCFVFFFFLSKSRCPSDFEVKAEARNALSALAGSDGGASTVGGAADCLLHDLAYDAGLFADERARKFSKRKVDDKETFAAHALNCPCVKRIAEAFRDCEPQDHVTRALLLQFVHDVPLETLNPQAKKQKPGKEGGVRAARVPVPQTRFRKNITRVKLPHVR